MREESLEEVGAPIYAWRAYRIEQIVTDYESQWVLTPLYYRHKTGGKPAIMVPRKKSEIFIDLLGWNEANEVPGFEDQNMHGGMPGFHCFHGYGQAVKYADDVRRGSHHITDVVVARVELGGVVVEHELGYRAEKTRVIELEHHDADEEKREKLAAALGWPFEIAYCDLLDTPLKPLLDPQTFEYAVEMVMQLMERFGISAGEALEAVTQTHISLSSRLSSRYANPYV